MTMSLHKLSAGHGYDYLIRQVAALDATHRGRTDLASYYEGRGETPGRWVGRGLAGIDGLEVGDVVTGEQMRLLFAEGRHPLAGATRGVAGGPAMSLGLPYRQGGREQPFLAALRDRFAAHNIALGLDPHAAVAAETRARIRSELAAEWFQQEHGRTPRDQLELVSALIRWSRPATTAVGGYDLTFSPVKSVSTLWAIAKPPIAAKIEQAHHAAVAAALRFVEDHALYTREGTGGGTSSGRHRAGRLLVHSPRQPGRRPRSAHPCRGGKQGSNPGRAVVVDRRPGAARGRRGRLGDLQHRPRAPPHHGAGGAVRRTAGRDRSKRPVREIVGVDSQLNYRWSRRRQVIDLRRAELAAAFTRDHGRPPSRVEMLQLAQQATLDTRDRKHEPRTLAEQRTVWRAEAEVTLGGPDRVDAMLRQVLNPAITAMPAATPA